MTHRINDDFQRGLSGCKIEFDSDLNVIKKISSSTSYNYRLANQVKKQILFSNFSIDGIGTPKVLSYSESELFHFEMDYISGQNPYNMFISGSKYDIDTFLKSIINYFNFTLSLKREQDIKEFKIKTKQKLHSLLENSSYKEFIKFLIVKTDDSTSSSFIKSFCHGDLTISNIIHNNNKLFLIDFLDSFLDSPIIDLVKLKQDLFYNWSLINLEKFTKEDLYRANQVSKFIWNTISKLYKNIIENPEFDIIESINFLRIEPYISSEMKVSLDIIIKSLKLYEEFNSTYGGKVI